MLQVLCIFVNLDNSETVGLAMSAAPMLVCAARNIPACSVSLVRLLPSACTVLVCDMQTHVSSQVIYSLKALARNRRLFAAKERLGTYDIVAVSGKA